MGGLLPLQGGPEQGGREGDGCLQVQAGGGGGGGRGERGGDVRMHDALACVLPKWLLVSPTARGARTLRHTHPPHTPRPSSLPPWYCQQRR